MQCAYSPNGLFIISASEDKTLKVWDSQTGKCVHSLNLKSYSYCCSVSMDGKKIVAGIGKQYLTLLSVPSSMNMLITSSASFQVTMIHYQPILEYHSCSLIILIQFSHSSQIQFPCISLQTIRGTEWDYTCIRECTIEGTTCWGPAKGKIFHFFIWLSTFVRYSELSAIWNCKIDPSLLSCCTAILYMLQINVIILVLQDSSNILATLLFTMQPSLIKCITLFQLLVGLSIYLTVEQSIGFWFGLIDIFIRCISGNNKTKHGRKRQTDYTEKQSYHRKGQNHIGKGWRHCSER